MRCAVWVGGNEFRVEERPSPEPGPGEVRVRVHACGVCMTDVHTAEGLLEKREPPFVFGHEWGGTVDAVGPEVIGIEVGARVAGAGQGGFAEHVVRAADRVFPIPSNAAFDDAPFAEPILCCAAAVQNARLRVGSVALVTGAGPMGLILLQLVRRGGAARVIVSEPSAARRALARQLGADEAVDPTKESLPDVIATLTRGVGVDAAFETAGHPVPLDDCLNAVAEGGTVVIVGVNPTTAHLDLPLYRFHRRNLTLRGSYGDHGNGGFGTAVNWLGQLDLRPLISHRFDLADIGEAFDLARSGRGLKVLVSSRIGATS